MQPSQACLSLIQEFEGCAKRQPDGTYAAYPDPGTGAAPWTIGWGTTGADIDKGLVWTQQQCDDRFAQDVGAFAGKVAAVIGAAPTTQNQFDAMVCFAYNVGVGNLQSSTLLKMHKAGNYAGAAGQFPLWNKAAGKVLPGLVRRRAAEAALYSTPG
jgi:lysozyme